MRRNRREPKLEERTPILVRSQASESDISEEPSEHGQTIGELTSCLDDVPKQLRMEIDLSTERQEQDFYVYDKKLVGGVKINEYSLVFSRQKLQRSEVRVLSIPLKLPSRLIYFEQNCPF
jgi:hypothetical protein